MNESTRILLLSLVLFALMATTIVHEWRLGAPRRLSRRQKRAMARRDRAFNRKLRQMHASEQEARLQKLLDTSNADREARRVVRRGNGEVQS